MNKYELQDEKIKKLESLGYKLSVDVVSNFYPYIDRYQGRKCNVSNSKIYTIKDKDGKEILKREIYAYENIFEETEKLNKILDILLTKHKGNNEKCRL